MEVVAFSAFRNCLKSYLEKTRDSAEVLLVTSDDPSSDVIVMNARDYESLMETVHIYENPCLHEKVLRGMRQAREGRATTHELLDGQSEEMMPDLPQRSKGHRAPERRRADGADIDMS